MEIKRWEHYTSQEIFEKFKELHDYAMRCLENVQNTGREKGDEEEEAFGLIMDLLGKDVWEIYNNYLEQKKSRKEREE